MSALKGEIETIFLLSHLKESPKQPIEVYYRIFIPDLLDEIFRLEILSILPFWIFADMHDTSQLGSRNLIFL